MHQLRTENDKLCIQMHTIYILIKVADFYIYFILTYLLSGIFGEFFKKLVNKIKFMCVIREH